MNGIKMRFTVRRAKVFFIMWLTTGKRRQCWNNKLLKTLKGAQPRLGWAKRYRVCRKAAQRNGTESTVFLFSWMNLFTCVEIISLMIDDLNWICCTSYIEINFVKVQCTTTRSQLETSKLCQPVSELWTYADLNLFDEQHRLYELVVKEASLLARVLDELVGVRSRLRVGTNQLTIPRNKRFGDLETDNCYTVITVWAERCWRCSCQGK